MNFIPPAALVLEAALLLVLCGVLAHMVSSPRSDARIEFLNRLMETGSATGEPRDSHGAGAGTAGAVSAPHPGAKIAARAEVSRPVPTAWRRIPSVLAVALRMRCI